MTTRTYDDITVKDELDASKFFEASDLKYFITHND